MSRAVCALVLAVSVFTITAASASAQTSGPPYTLTVTTPTGGKLAGAGINCGAGGTACAVTMPAAMKIGLQATASTGYTFTAWTGDCTGTTASLWVALNGPRNCGATFTPVGGSTPTTPVITWATPAPITQGTALSATQLNATTTVAGTLVHTPAAGTVLPAGSHTLSTIFTPSNTTLYTSASRSVTLVVNAAASPSGGRNVYDANGTEIGPMGDFHSVWLWLDGQGYAAAVGPDGWVPPTISLYFLNSTCTGGPYGLRSYEAAALPPAPAPLTSYFVKTLYVVGSAGYYQTGEYVSRALSNGTPNVWYREQATGPCTAWAGTGWIWFDRLGTVPLPAYQIPFAIR